MKTKILRNIFISAVTLFALAMPLAAGTSDGGLNFSNMPLLPPRIMQALNLPLDGGYASRNTAVGTGKAVEEAAVAKAAAREPRIDSSFDSHSPKAEGTFISFDAPGAVTGTFPSSINPSGAITGYYSDENFVGHGFVRNHNGTFIAFDVPNDVSGTYPSSISSSGAITGQYGDENFVGHGFLRDHNGTVVVFDAPGAQFYLTLAINPAGTITGTFFDVNFVTHGVIRAKDGAITTFDVPGAVNGTEAVAISPAGVITGIYTDGSFVSHGFLRDRHGAFTTFDPPTPGFINAFAPFSFGPDLSIMPNGVITGTYFEFIPGNPFGGNYRVFVRATDGSFTTFDAATYPPCCIWSFPSGMNPAGTITGSFNDGFTINHGFVRASDGTITTFDAPGAGTGFNQGTAPLGITPGGVIMGLYIDANYGVHGFLRIP